MILTGDNRLRKEAQRQGFEVHGILWVFEQLVNIEVLSPLIASEKLRELMSINFWLPVGECDKLIEKFNLDHIK
jgi:predicted nucleic acid-binding protein